VAVTWTKSASLLLKDNSVPRPAVLPMIGDAAAVLTVLDELAGICVPVALDYRWRPAATDPDDDMVIETAVNGGAEVIATFSIDDMRAGC